MELWVAVVIISGILITITGVCVWILFRSQIRSQNNKTELMLMAKQANEKNEFLQNAKEMLTDQFKNLATDILEEKTKRFTDHNKENLTQLLSPLQEKLASFQKQVKEAYDTEKRDRSMLIGQIEMMQTLNRTITEETQNLTKALKGSSKIQGNWGEVILERILEESGLRKGHEYQTQVSVKTTDGNRIQPDVIIQLPENRQIIIDSKVSLVAYAAYVSSQEEVEQATELKRHIESVRTHIKTLSSKNYQEACGLSTLDFVILFMPLEPAFITAMANDASLLEEAWRQNVILVGPSTLLFSLRTVEYLWRQEHQSKNAQAIAERGQELYRRLYGFITELENVGKEIEKALRSYESAYKKLCQGQGNVLWQAKELENLGIKPSKKITEKMIADVIQEDVNTALGEN